MATDIIYGIHKGSGGGTPTASNGLTQSGSDIQLGGTLLGNTDIDLNAFPMTIGPMTVQDLSAQLSVAPVNPDDIMRLGDLPTATSFDNGITQTAGVAELGGNLVKDTAIDTNGHSLDIAGLVITDTEATYANAPVNPTDLVRLEDLAAATTFDNGITETAGVAELGGPLTKATTIDTGSHAYEMSNNGRANAFFLDSTNVAMQSTSGSFTALSSCAGGLFLCGIENNLGVRKAIQINDGSGMLVQDQLDSQGLTNAADYSANHAPLRLVQYNEISSLQSPIVASNKVAGVMASGNLITYAIPAGTETAYRVNPSAVFRSGVGSCQVTLQWTDTGGNVNNKSFTSLAAAGGSSDPATVIYCQNGTNIVIDQIITGTAIADYANFIEILG